MKIRFADSRPDGDYALVLPVAGKDRVERWPRSAPRSRRWSAALDRQRFEGDASSASRSSSSMTVERCGGVVVVGTGTGSSTKRSRREARRHGGRALQTSGERSAPSST